MTPEDQAAWYDEFHELMQDYPDLYNLAVLVDAALVYIEGGNLVPDISTTNMNTLSRVWVIALDLEKAFGAVKSMAYNLCGQLFKTVGKDKAALSYATISLTKHSAKFNNEKWEAMLASDLKLRRLVKTTAKARNHCDSLIEAAIRVPKIVEAQEILNTLEEKVQEARKLCYTTPERDSDEQKVTLKRR